MACTDADRLRGGQKDKMYLHNGALHASEDAESLVLVSGRSRSSAAAVAREEVRKRKVEEAVAEQSAPTPKKGVSSPFLPILVLANPSSQIHGKVDVGKADRDRIDALQKQIADKTAEVARARAAARNARPGEKRSRNKELKDLDAELQNLKGQLRYFPSSL